MSTTLPFTRRPKPAQDVPCVHRPGCACRRPTLGRALVASVALELLLAVVTLIAGAPVVGLVACGAMTVCMVAAVVAEAMAFHRVGLIEPDNTEIGNHQAVGRTPSRHALD